MIGMLTGVLFSADADRCIMDVGGVGYLVYASSRTLARLELAPAKNRLLIETIVREDAILLYGFLEEEEKEWFRLLTTVQGVGAKVGLAVLSVFSPQEVTQIIHSGDKVSLTRVAGVGPRLAARVLTELRDKAPSGLSSGGGSFASTVVGMNLSVSGNISMESDVLSALEGLGFRRLEALGVVRRVITQLGDEASLDDVIRDSLKELARK